MIAAVGKIVSLEDFIKAHFQVYGSGRLTASDIGSHKTDFNVKLLHISELLRELKPRLEELKEKRKPRIDHDENLILYVMSCFLNRKFDGALALAATDTEIATFVNSWGDTLIGTADDTYELYEGDIRRRIDRFREEHDAAAAAIDANPKKYIKQLLIPIFTNGLLPDARRDTAQSKPDDLYVRSAINWLNRSQ